MTGEGEIRDRPKRGVMQKLQRTGHSSPAAEIERSGWSDR